MKLEEPYIINHQEYTKSELISLSETRLCELPEGHWEHELYRFVLDFFDLNHDLTQKTSGTTGEPKSYILNRASMIASANMTLNYFHLTRGSSALLSLPVDYIAGKMMVVRALAGGLNLVLREPSNRPFRNLDEDIDFGAIVPLQLYETLASGDSLQNIKKLLIGGGEMNNTLREKVLAIDGTEVFESFAMTETYSHFAIRRSNGNNPEAYFEVMPGALISVDQRGCLVVDVPGVTNGNVVTNDLVELRSRDSFLWQGRIDHVIKSGGIKIIPEVLETKVKDVINLELLVIGVPDEKLGQKLVLVVEGDESEFPIEEWLIQLREKVEKHEVPKKVIGIEKIPRNRSMKVDRLAVTKLFI